MRFVTIFVLLILNAASVVAETIVELELVLLADASSSIKDGEFDLQINGYANAFRDPKVIEAINSLGGNGIAVTFVQWSATFQQYDIVPWRRIHDATSAHAFAAEIETQARQFVAFGTATGSALIEGNRRFSHNGFLGRRKVIDITSDEHSKCRASSPFGPRSNPCRECHNQWSGHPGRQF